MNPESGLCLTLALKVDAWSYITQVLEQGSFMLLHVLTLYRWKQISGRSSRWQPFLASQCAISPRSFPLVFALRLQNEAAQLLRKRHKVKSDNLFRGLGPALKSQLLNWLGQSSTDVLRDNLDPISHSDRARSFDAGCLELFLQW